MEHEEFLEARRGTIGSSDAAAILGLCPFRDPLMVWFSHHSPENAFKGNNSTKWGSLLEEVVAQAYTEETGIELYKPDPEITRNPDFPFAHASVDRKRVDNHQIVEIKTARSSQGWGESGTDEIPVGYKIQVIHQMMVEVSECAEVAVLIGGSDFRTYYIQRDQDLIEELVAAERLFYDNYLAGDIPPEPDFSHPSIHAFIKKIYGCEFSEIWCDATEELILLEKFGEAKSSLSKKKKEMESLEAQVLSLMGESSKLVASNGIILERKEINRKGYVVQPTTYTKLSCKFPQTEEE